MSQAGMSALERINNLLDSNSFVEIGSYISARNTDFNLADKETPKDGVLTGYGTIEGSLVYVYSQDTKVLGGSMGEMHAKKIVSLYAQAIKMGAPIIGLVDCAGLRLQEATDALDGFGKLYLSQTMASGVIPQIQAIFGTCGGGMAVSAALADFTFMEGDLAKLFVNSPNSIIGSSEKKLDSSSAKYQSHESGIVDFVADEVGILAGIRTLISILPTNNEDDLSFSETVDDLNRLVPEVAGIYKDAAALLSVISDSHFYLEPRADYAPEMVTAFIRLGGNTVGCIANRSLKYISEEEKIEYKNLLSHKSVDKAADFVKFCDAFNIPILTLVDVAGYKTTTCTEKRMPRAAANLTFAFANATVPKVTLILDKAFGSAYLTMNSKSIGADVVFAWKQARIATMDAESAARIIYADEIEKAEDSLTFIAEKTKEYEELQSSVLAAARRGYVDDIIDEADTRKRLIAAFEMLFTKREERPYKKHGSF